MDRRLPLPPRSVDVVQAIDLRRGDFASPAELGARAARPIRSLVAAGGESLALGVERTSPTALRAALRLARNPGLAAMFRRTELPPGVHRLILVSAGSAGSDAALLAGEDPTFLRAAAIYYLEQILWSDGADHYRALGLHQGASERRISEHAWLLMEWLHPHVGSANCEAAFADRVIEAWTALKAENRKRPTRRAALRVDLQLSPSRLR